jgi:hypothetical protein
MRATGVAESQPRPDQRYLGDSTSISQDILQTAFPISSYTSVGSNHRVNPIIRNVIECAARRKPTLSTPKKRGELSFLEWEDEAPQLAGRKRSIAQEWKWEMSNLSD